VNTISDKIQVVTAKMNVEHDAVKKQELQKELIKLKIRGEIEKLQKRLEGLT